MSQPPPVRPPPKATRLVTVIDARDVLLRRLTNEIIDRYARGEVTCEPVRTSFDEVLPGMPPAVRIRG